MINYFATFRLKTDSIYQIQLCKMVKGPRRSRSNYSVNLRCHGKTLKERSDSEKFKKLFIISLGIYFYIRTDTVLLEFLMIIGHILNFYIVS